MTMIFSYPDILAAANAFMDRSGIRAFCRRRCGGECCDALREYEDDRRCLPGAACSERLPCVLFLCGKAEALLQPAMDIGDPRWSVLMAVEDEARRCVSQRLIDLGVSKPDPFRSHYHSKHMLQLSFTVGYPVFTDEEYEKIRNIADREL